MIVTKLMKLLIFSLDDAVAHCPQEPTYAIRIFSAYQRNNPLWEQPLASSEFYRAICTYYFDDVEPFFASKSEVLLDDGIAMKILDDFRRQSSGCKSLLVHCSRGRNRSPAVAIALNDIFGLGHDSDLLMKKYPDSNWYVYDKLIEAGRKL